jgi:ribosomal protein S18 acetylase RimI-like enzyme
MGDSIRPGNLHDLERLQEIEKAAGLAFREVGMHAIAKDEPLPLEVLADYQRRGHCWVATDQQDEVVGYVVVDVVDGAAHVEQVSVHPGWARRRIGERLLDTVAAWARAQGLKAMTLTTFSEVPWNRPYYERLGFRVLEQDEFSAGLLHIQAEEAARGLDRWPRVTMRRELNH